jgi:OmcA/MtrC family decaheme c-type cytochrome
VKLGWSTGDYENTGNGSEQSSMISQSALDTATANGDGTFNVQFSATIPDGSEAPGVAASGSGVAVIDGHPNVVLEEDGEPESIFITDAHAFFSIDESDGSPRARRKIVDTQNCLVCHQNLVLHGGNRADNVESCVGCHNPRNSDRDVREIAANPPTDGKQQESIHFTRMVHGIHAAGYRENPLQIVGFRGFTTHVFDEDRVQFPGKLNNCTTCHGDSGFELPLAASVRGTSIDTGDDREDPADDILISPTASACSSCHDSIVAAAHMEQNGGSFSTTQAALDGGEVIEQCELCHGPGRSVGVRAVHGL